MAQFEVFWEYLQANLKAGMKIWNWTADKGYFSDDIIIEGLDADSVMVRVSEANNIQVVPRGQFEIVFNAWDEYKAHRLMRSELRRLTRFSRYIINILRWYEQRITQGENRP